MTHFGKTPSNFRGKNTKADTPRWASFLSLLSCWAPSSVVDWGFESLTLFDCLLLNNNNNLPFFHLHYIARLCIVVSFVDHLTPSIHCLSSFFNRWKKASNATTTGARQAKHERKNSRGTRHTEVKNASSSSRIKNPSKKGERRRQQIKHASHLSYHGRSWP